MTTPVLLVDDDVELAEMLRDYLQSDGFAVELRHDGDAAIQAMSLKPYALVVLDVMMPGKSGIEVLRHIRQHSTTPVLMLTARGDDIDRIMGLELGADDYVPKPCSPRELAARIRAILRRSTTTETNSHNHQQCITVGGLSLWPAQRMAEWNGRQLNLTSTEFNLLEVLASRAGTAVSKNELSEQGLGRPLARFDRSIDVHMSSIRHKLGCLQDGRSCIQTVIRKGYQLIRE